MFCVDLGESFQMRLTLQNSASIQPRSSPFEFGLPACPGPPLGQRNSYGPLSTTTGAAGAARIEAARGRTRFLGCLCKPFLTRQGGVSFFGLPACLPFLPANFARLPQMFSSKNLKISGINFRKNSQAHRRRTAPSTRSRADP